MRAHSAHASTAGGAVEVEPDALLQPIDHLFGLFAKTGIRVDRACLSEAELVRHIFERFIQLVSVTMLVCELQARNR